MTKTLPILSRAMRRRRMPVIPCRRPITTPHHDPGTGEMAVLWDGTGLVVKRVEIVPRFLIQYI